MRKIIQRQKEEHWCDCCKKEITGCTEYILDAGFGSELDGNTYDFCSSECLKKFIKDKNL